MRIAVFGIVCIVCLLVTPRLNAQSGCRPCGPDSLRGPMRYLIPQGAAGADFRFACKAHDECYVTPGANRSVCDCQFRDNLLKQCQHSRNPRRCRRVAMMMYRSVRKYGENAFRQSQTE